MAAVVRPHERECAVCTTDFTTPKILPCGHILCRQCLISWMDKKSDAGCPLCTCPIVEHPGNSPQSSADVVDTLPTDYVMEAIVESSRLLVKPDTCTVCEDVAAEYICMQCLEKMCQSCMKTHKKMVVSRTHDVESFKNVTAERMAASRPALCADHGDEQANLFCASHHRVICTSCASNKHSDCPDVKYLDVQMNSSETALGSMTKKLAIAEDDLKKAIVNLTVRIKTADASKHDNMALVDKTCDGLQKIVEECRKQLKELINDSICKFKKFLCDVKSELEKRLGKVTSHKHLVTRATTVRPRPALIHTAEALTDRVNSLHLSNELETDSWASPSPEIKKHCDDVMTVMKAELHSLQLQLTKAEPPVLVFHENCGRNVLLTNSKTTARKAQRKLKGNGAVVSRDAMAVNVLYEVRVDEIDSISSIMLGVTGTPPAQLTSETWSYHLAQSIIICCNDVRYNGHPVESNVGKALKYIKVGSRVGLLLDSSHDLHLYIDGQDQGVAAENVAKTCFAVFDLNFVIQVTSLPTSKRI